ncbi:GDSL-type esterase/lipase family protein [Streptomyces sp. NPDC001027]|uniref:GDSL-type esterase/lipase family protein n=1 Tax=Streptomyces sp. NPDC001027 TaxID=3154771 RepID=UPI0033214860
MNITVAVVLALASVATHAAAAATQHRVASTGGHGLRRLSAGPAWWASNSANATGATLHVAALTYGPLTLGQCLGALTVTAAVPLAARGAGRRVSRGEWHGMALTLAGFAALLPLTATGEDSTGLLTTPAALAIAVTASLAIPLALSVRTGTLRTLALAAASGIASGANAPQLSALSPKTRLVTLGIGGNDIGFGSMIKRCVTVALAYQALGGTYIPEDALCRGHYVHRRTDEVQRKIEAAGERLAGALTEINRRAPQARVYVVGYPAILPAEGTEGTEGTGCGGELPLAPGDMSYLREKEQQLNSELRERAQTSGAVYVDTYRPSEGRDACSDAATRWIEPLVPSSPAAAVHPNERGERGMADAVLDALR